ncbi:MAG: DNA polymerase III subunit gamma/tau [Rhizobacter sp.]|nr:DNA polymerase III subunit gamma/tau [Rhizobacter sp.]
MSYVVLARKYRPPNFDALVGQEHVVQALANALTQQRLHHAYLFTGTRGVGKTTISRILAKSLNCTGADGQGGITAHPCGVCDACRDIDSGRFIDYVELDAASNRGVDEISQLLDQADYKPVVGRFKVYMIDEVHMLSTTAFNAMLKTLEEPPEYLKFVLATTDPQKVPATVLSRCLQFNLRPMAPQTVQAHLVDVLALEQIPAEPGALRLLARAARGSMRDALSLTDQAIAFGAGALAEQGVRQMLGAVDRGHALRIIEALAAADGAGLVGAVDALRALGLSASGTLEEMAALLQQMAVLQAVPEAADADDPDTSETARVAALFAPDETQLCYSITLHGRAELGLAPDEYSGLVMVLLRMLAFRPQGAAVAPVKAAVSMSAVAMPLAAVAPVARAVTAAPPERVPAAPVRPRAPGFAAQPASVAAAPALRVTTGADEPPPWLDVPFEGEPAAPPHPPPSRRPVRDAAVLAAEPVPVMHAVAEEAAISFAPIASPLVPTALGARWAELARQLSDANLISAFARELAMQAQCVAFDEQAAALVCELRVERETLRASTHCDKLQAALAEWLQRPVRLEVAQGVAEDSPARREAAERARRQTEAEQIIHDDPLVQALMAQYKTARIVPGSVKPH